MFAMHILKPTLIGNSSRLILERASRSERLANAGIPNTSVELVQGALGESADFLIATYGMGSEHREGAKPTAFNASAAPQSDCSKDNLAAQDRVQVRGLCAHAVACDWKYATCAVCFAGLDLCVVSPC